MRKHLLLIIAAVTAFALILAGCSGGSFGMSSDENTLTITAENADDDMAASTTVTIEENTALETVADFSTDGTVRLDIYQGVVSFEDDDDYDVIDADEDKLLFSIMMSGTETLTHEIDPGEYTIVAEVEGKVTGTGKVNLVPAQ